MVRLRLRKVGSKAQQAFRIVAAEHEHPRDGRFLENLGNYNPRTQPATIEMDEARIYQWLKNGAQPSESVERLFRTTGTMARFARFQGGEAAETLAAAAKMQINEQDAEKQMKRTEAIIQSMTTRERRNPDVLNGSRKRRIATGSGTTVYEVNQLIKQFKDMQKMMKQLGNRRGIPGLPRAR